MNNIGKGIFIIVLGLVLGVACKQVEENVQTKITFMNGWGGVSKDHIAMREIYQGFNEISPDIELVPDTSPDLYIVIEKAKEMLAVGKMPNIVSTNGNSDFIDYANKKGYLVDLMPYIKSDPEFASSIPKQVYDNWEKEGSLYTIPDVIEMSGYWYNKEIFEAAGIKQVPRTWEEFWEACNLIDKWSEREQNGVIPVLMESNQAALAFLGARIAGDSSAGTALMLGGPETFDHTLLMRALDDLVNIYEYGKEKGSSLSFNDSLNAFNKGKTAMYFNGVWANVLIEPTIDVAATNYPGYDGKGVAYVSTSSGYVISNTEGQDKISASIKFLKHMLSEDVQYKILYKTKQVPSNPNLTFEDGEENIPLLIEAINTIGKAEITINTLRTAWGDRYISILQDNLEALIEGRITSRQLLQKLETERKEIKTQD